MIAILFALEIEAGGLIDLLDQKTTIRAKNLTVYQGQLHGQEVMLGVIGTGPERAAEVARTFIEAHRPERVVLAGFAGGLQPSLKRLDIVMIEGEEVKLILFGAAKEEPAPLPQGSFGPAGPIVTVEKVVHAAEEKRQLGRQTGALLVDMESAAVRQACDELAVPFSNMRIVIDPMDEELSSEIQHLTNQPSLIGRIGAAIGAIWRRPSSFKEMLRLRGNAIEASDRLAQVLCKIYL